MNDNWDAKYIRIAREVSSWSKDPGKKIGAIIVGTKNQIISQGYNGFPRGVDDSEVRYSDRVTKLKYTVHAEANAIYNAIHNSANTNGATIYITGLPVCHECAKAIIQVGISTVVMDNDPRVDHGNGWEESGKLSLEMFRESGVNVKFLGDV